MVPRRARLGRRRDRQPGRVDALQLRDPRRARALAGADRRGAPLERRRSARTGAGISVVARRSRRSGSSGKGRTGTARRSSSSAAPRDGRVDRLPRAPRGAAPRHEPGERPLPDAVSELECGAARRARARAALHRLSVRGSGARDRGRRVRRGERDLFADPRRAARRDASASRRRAHATRATRRSTPAGSSSSRATASSRSCARSRTRTSSTRSAARPRSRTTAFERFADEGDVVGRTERDLAWRFEQLLHERGRGRALVPRDHRRVGPERGHAARRARATAAIEPGETVVVDAGCVVDGYCSDCTRTFATGKLPDELEARVRGRVSTPSSPRSTRFAPGASGPGRRRGRARRDRGGRLRRARSATGSVTASGSRCTRCHGSHRSRGARSRRATSSPSSRASTSPGSAASASRTSWSSRTASRGADDLPEGAA